MRNKLYAMGLIETFCFINTIGEDWWHFKDDILIYSDGLSVEKCYITTAQPQHYA